MRSLKILHTDFHRGWGGQAQRVLMLSRELVSRGHRVMIAASSGELSSRARDVARETPGLTIDDGFRFRPPSSVVSFLRDWRRMIALLAREEFDIVDVHGSQDMWVTAAARARSGRPRCLVLTRHNTKRVRTGLTNRMLYRRAIDHLIIVDESVREMYAPLLAKGIITPESISVVPSAYRADLFHKGIDGNAVRRELGMGDETTIIGVTGRLVVDKGHTFLFQAVNGLRERFPNLAVVLAGQGPNEDRLRAEVRALGIDTMVHFLGFRKDIPRVAAAFDIAVLPSIGCDASSATIKEAMALGVPVIASDIGGAKSIIRDGRTGVVVPAGESAPLAEALRTMIRYPEQARAMAVLAREDVRQRYSIDRLADGTLAAYETAITRVNDRRSLQRSGAYEAGRSV